MPRNERFSLPIPRILHDRSLRLFSVRIADLFRNYLLEIYMKGERNLEFTEYAKGLFPFISFGKKEAPYFVELIGNYIKDSAMDSCTLLRRKPDTQYRYINGSPIQAKDAQYLYDHRDTAKFSQWILDRMDESESFDSVCDWLKENGMPGDYPETNVKNYLPR